MNEPVIVAKFGGSSLADACKVRLVSEIIASDKRRRFIVVSAPGKRNAADEKITDLLYSFHALRKAGVDASTPLTVVRHRFLEMAEELMVGEMPRWLSEMEAELTRNNDLDWIASRGEYLSARLMAGFLGADFVDAADLIRFDANGQLLPEETYQLASTRLAQVPEGRLAVIPGFYGADVDGRIRCFSRGGSDISGSIVTRAVNGLVYENWTDVSGMLMADPRVVDNPKPIAEMTYREQRELSYMGATVLHEEAVFPVREAGIPIHIRNTDDPNAPGTRIVNERDSTHTSITGIAGRRGFSVISIEKAMMNRDASYGLKVLRVLEEYGVPYEHSPAAIDTFGLIVTQEQLGGQEETLISEIQRVAKPDRIDVRRDIALIGVVGQGMARRVGVAAAIFNALTEINVNICLANQWTSEFNVIIGVAGEDFEKSVRAIYDRFSGETLGQP